MASPFTGTDSTIWYGEEFDIEPKYDNNKELLQLELEDFIDVSLKQYGNKHTAAQYYKLLKPSKELAGFETAIHDQHPYLKHQQYKVLTPSIKPFEQRSELNTTNSAAIVGVSWLLVLLTISMTKLDERRYQDRAKDKKVIDKDLKDALKFVIPIGDMKVAAILNDIIIAVYIVMLLLGYHFYSPTASDLLEVGGVLRYKVMHGEPWRLFTAIFIHAGIGHLIANVLGTYFAVILTREIIKPLPTILVYILCGIGSSVLSIMWHENTVSVGASGAIMGLMGYSLSWAFRNKHPEPSAVYLLSGLAIVLTFGMGLVTNADNAGHLGGLVSGLLIGLATSFMHTKAPIAKA